MWYPNPDRVYPKDGETNEEALRRETKECMSHMTKLMYIFLDKDDVKKFEAPDIKTYAQESVNKLTPHISEKKVNIKVRYDKDGQYPELGGRNRPDYIEENTEGEEPSLFFSDWERTNRLTKSVTPIEATDVPVVPGPDTSNGLVY